MWVVAHKHIVDHQKSKNILFTSSGRGLKAWQIVLRYLIISLFTMRIVVTACKEWWPNNGGGSPGNDCCI